MSNFPQFLTHTIDHETYEGDKKVTYKVEFDRPTSGKSSPKDIDILTINGVDINYLTDSFVDVIRNEVVSDIISEETGVRNQDPREEYPYD